MTAREPCRVDEGLLRRWPLPPLAHDGDKQARGACLVVAGSAEIPGAAWLAATSALRVGAGKLVVATAARVAPGLALRLPEARVVGLAELPEGGLGPQGVDVVVALIGQADAVLIGPGLQDEVASRRFVRAVIDRLDGASHPNLVLDALAMNVAGPAFARPVLMTPHAGEMAHLTGLTKDAVCADPERVARDAATRWNAVVALKGATTVIASPDGQAWRHEGGGVGLATSGSGDTLVGVITGLLARGANLEQAAVWGVALHARAGRALAQTVGPVGFLASELPGQIPSVLRALCPDPTDG